MTPALSCVNRTERPTDWNAIDWRQANRNVRRLRHRIFRATQEGDWDKVQSLQRLLLRSRSNVLVGVRRITQTNQGRHTPGVDKVIVKTPKARGHLVDEIRKRQSWRAQPTRRIYIPKANGKQRPLGIPTIADRCLQAVVKNALEPSWEARFERTSYGFRPGRSCHDAIAKIYLLARPHKRKKWVIDADIKGAFDNIDHEHLLRTIGPFPGRELVRRWLKAGYMEDRTTHPTEYGTPQGGIISPLLANIALHGMEDALGVQYNNQGELRSQRAIVRYADDFVVFCETEADAETAQQVLTNWLAERGLTLSAEKTRIVYLTTGFDFLGFNIKHYEVKNTRTGYKLLIKPSRSAQKAIRKRLRTEWRRLIGSNVKAVIRQLNPIIRGWANYFRIAVASRTFSKLDHWMFRRQVRYVRRTHPHKPRYWTTRQYWGSLNPARADNWVFGDKHTGMYLAKFQWYHIKRHVLVKGTASPDDPELQQYWEQRKKGAAQDLTLGDQQLAQSQNYRCPVCGETLFNGEELHRHHRRPKHKGGSDEDGNRRLVHLYCHQQIHSGTRLTRAGNGEPLLL